MLFCLTYLCSRLMESSVEIRACVMIQICYRNYRKRILRRLQIAAARTILAAWRLHRWAYYAARERRYGAAVRVIEAFVAMHKPALRVLRLRRLAWEKSNEAAILVQVRIQHFTVRLWPWLLANACFHIVPHKNPSLSSFNIEICPILVREAVTGNHGTAESIGSRFAKFLARQSR